MGKGAQYLFDMGWLIRLTNYVVSVKWRCRYFSVGIPGICQPLFVCLFCSVFLSLFIFVFHHVFVIVFMLQYTYCTVPVSR